jgi:adenylate cyclase, class 2
LHTLDILSELPSGRKPGHDLDKEAMAQETEIKLRIVDAEAFRQSLVRLNAKAVFRGSGRIHEMNLIFDTAQGGLAKKAQLLRIRTETPVTDSGIEDKAAPTRAILTFKRPASGPRRSDSQSEALAKEPTAARHKVRDEIETVVTDAATLATIFEGLGMRGWFRYEKYRTTYRLPARWAKGLLIELDETPVGNFVELEGPPQTIDRAAKELGYSKADYVVENYLTLYRAECRKRGVVPRNMLFATRQRRVR